MQWDGSITITTER
jgi:hypothetical protein